MITHFEKKHPKLVPIYFKYGKCGRKYYNTTDLFNYLYAHKLTCDTAEKRLKQKGKRSSRKHPVDYSILILTGMDTKWSIELIYTKNTEEVLKRSIRKVDARYEENKFGKQLKIRVWVTTRDILTDDFYGKIYAHLFGEIVTNGMFLKLIFEIINKLLFLNLKMYGYILTTSNVFFLKYFVFFFLK